MNAHASPEDDVNSTTAQLPLDQVRAVLNAHGLVVTGLTAELISGGRSNLTYRLAAETSEGHRSWVLRRPPLGHVLPTAHDMGREYKVIAALGGTDVPVPGVVLMCHDPEVIGTPFYVMEHVEGAILGTDNAVQEQGKDAEQIGSSLIKTLADLHDLDPAAIGLSDFGRPSGFMERQVRRWTAQLESSRSRDLHGVDALAADLSASVPTRGDSALIHGDFRLDNTIVREGRVVAVLDWEMSTLGDPLADLALFTVYTGGFAEFDQSVIHSPAGVGDFPSTDTLVEDYLALTNRAADDLGWYVSFAWFKLAVILEGIHFRSLIGKSAAQEFRGVQQLVPYAIERGRAALAAKDWRSSS